MTKMTTTKATTTTKTAAKTTRAPKAHTYFVGFNVPVQGGFSNAIGHTTLEKQPKVTPSLIDKWSESLGEEYGGKGARATITFFSEIGDDPKGKTK